MAGKVKTKKEREEERQLKSMAELFEKRGIAVRREKLSRGPSFRVKSGDCMLTGKKVLFIDKRLPADQQFSVMLDYLKDFKIDLSPEEIGEFPKPVAALFNQRSSSI